MAREKKRYGKETRHVNRLGRGKALVISMGAAGLAAIGSGGVLVATASNAAAAPTNNVVSVTVNASAPGGVDSPSVTANVPDNTYDLDVKSSTGEVQWYVALKGGVPDNNGFTFITSTGTISCGQNVTYQLLLVQTEGNPLAASGTVQLNGCSSSPTTKTVSWVMASDKGTATNVTYPQYIEGSKKAPTCGHTIQTDVYKYSTEQEKSVVDALIAGGVLDNRKGHGPYDGSVVISWSFSTQDACKPCPTPTPTPTPTVVPTPPSTPIGTPKVTATSTQVCVAGVKKLEVSVTNTGTATAEGDMYDNGSVIPNQNSFTIEPGKTVTVFGTTATGNYQVVTDDGYKSAVWAFTGGPCNTVVKTSPTPAPSHPTAPKPPTSSGPTLPFTGFPTLGASLLAAGLVGIGGLLLFTSRRRRGVTIS